MMTNLWRFMAIVLLLAILPNDGGCDLISVATTYLGTGYNLLTGNPEGSNIREGGLDPGLNPTMQILKVDRKSGGDGCPVQATCVMLSASSSIDQYNFVDDGKKYRGEYQTSWGLETSASGIIKGVSLSFGGSGSKSSKEVDELVENKQSVMITNQTWQIFADGKYDYNIHKDFTEEFLVSLCKLSGETLEELYFNFFKKWGTHVITKVRLGSKSIERSIYTKDDYMNVVQRDYSSMLSVEGSVGIPMMSVSSKFTTSGSSALSNTLQKTAAVERRFSTYTGSKDAPVPVSMDLLDMSEFVNSLHVDTKKPECSKLTDQSLTDFRQKLSDFIVKYLKSGGNLVEEITRNMQINWPKGTYSLLKPKGGCPPNWESGSRYEDTQDKNNANAYSSGLSKILEAILDTNIGLNFCTKTTQSFPNTFDWGIGSYCIFKKEACPVSFENANIYIDDEDKNNKNSVQGVLPSGEYGRNTRYDLCCRNDGPADKPLFLPTQDPFFLLPVLHSCQDVAGMTSEMHFIKWDSSDSNPESSISGKVVPRNEDTGNKDYKVYLCYYTRKS